MAPAKVDKILPFHDPRITLRSAHLNGHTYGYLFSQPPPTVRQRGTILLVHGFPDISMGWRYQIPLFLSLGLTVIAPDCLGYGRSDSPPTSCISAYTYKTISDDMAELLRQLGISQVILGGHDWGGAIVYRIAQYYPQLVTALFSICTPYFPPNPKYEPLAILVKNRIPNFAYQMHFASGDVEAHVQSASEIRGFLNAMYGARGPAGETGFVAEQGVLWADFAHWTPSTLLDPAELDYYVQEYARHGINGPLNWYRNREANFTDEWTFFFDGGKNTEAPPPKIQQECLFVLATKDTALKPFMAAKMGERIENLTRKQVDAGHWALWQKPEEVNAILKEWLEGKILRDQGKSKL